MRQPRILRIELVRAQIELEDRTVEAPFEGLVGITEVDPGVGWRAAPLPGRSTRRRALLQQRTTVW